MSEFLETIYLRCREQHDSAVRWSAVMVGIVLVLHFTVLTEMARLQRDLAANKRALAQSARAVEASERLAVQLEAFDRSTVGFSSNLLQRFVADLKSDFRRLSAALELAMQDAPKPGTPVPPEGLSPRPFNPASQFNPPAAAQP